MNLMQRPILPRRLFLGIAAAAVLALVALPMAYASAPPDMTDHVYPIMYAGGKTATLKILSFTGTGPWSFTGTMTKNGNTTPVTGMMAQANTGGFQVKFYDDQGTFKKVQHTDVYEGAIQLDDPADPKGGQFMAGVLTHVSMPLFSPALPNGGPNASGPFPFCGDGAIAGTIPQ
jgi:hypothetical protein